MKKKIWGGEEEKKKKNTKILKNTTTTKIQKIHIKSERYKKSIKKPKHLKIVKNDQKI